MTLQFLRDDQAQKSHYTNYKAVPKRYQNLIDEAVLERYHNEKSKELQSRIQELEKELANVTHLKELSDEAYVELQKDQASFAKWTHIHGWHYSVAGENWISRTGTLSSTANLYKEHLSKTSKEKV